MDEILEPSRSQVMKKETCTYKCSAIHQSRNADWIITLIVNTWILKVEQVGIPN